MKNEAKGNQTTASINEHTEIDDTIQNCEKSDEINVSRIDESHSKVDSTSKETAQNNTKKIHSVNTCEETNNYSNKADDCGHCGISFKVKTDYESQKRFCVPDEDFGFDVVSDDTNERSSTASGEVDSGIITEEESSVAEETENSRNDVPAAAYYKNEIEQTLNPKKLYASSEYYNLIEETSQETDVTFDVVTDTANIETENHSFLCVCILNQKDLESSAKMEETQMPKFYVDISQEDSNYCLVTASNITVWLEELQQFYQKNLSTFTANEVFDDDDDKFQIVTYCPKVTVIQEGDQRRKTKIEQQHVIISDITTPDSVFTENVPIYIPGEIPVAQVHAPSKIEGDQENDSIKEDKHTAKDIFVNISETIHTVNRMKSQSSEIIDLKQTAWSRSDDHSGLILRVYRSNKIVANAILIISLLTAVIVFFSSLLVVKTSDCF